MTDKIDENKFIVLIVDDAKENLFALSSLLASEDVTVVQALSGTAALELMLKYDFGLALLDIQMPGMNGLELAELMRGSNKTKSIPIIFVTALSNSENYAFKGYETGAVDFLRKPLDSHAVKSKVNVFLLLHQHKKELEKQIEALKLTRLELEQSVKMREEFMAIAGHELKTPLTSLKLQTQMRLRHLDSSRMDHFSPEKLKNMFEADNKQLIRLTRLIDDMLDVSRLDSGKLSMDPENFDLCILIKDIVDRNIKVSVAGDSSLKLTTCETLIGDWDKCRIEQVVSNLLSNAMRYGEGKPIDINISIKNECASIVIKDHGVGITKNDLERIFNKYERATDTEFSGLGIGLYIVNQIIEAHNGSIKVKSKIGEGSEFTISLPFITS